MGVDPFGLCGRVIDGQFRVDRVVGEGGFSVVYQGMHMGLREPVAIKCMKLQPSLDSQTMESFAQRFRDESRLSYRLSQGNLDIVRCLAAGATASPVTGAIVPYMVLEWLDGRSLGAELRQRRAEGRAGRTLDEVVSLFDPAAKAIAYAHQQGVVHRDVKPGNLFLARLHDGTVRLKVLDFGLAKIVDEQLGIVPSVQTMAHIAFFSPSYGAPEQFDPQVGRVGPHTDVYSLALVILECMRDRRVREGDGIAQCAVKALDPKAQPTCHALGIKVRPRVEVVLARAVQLDPKARQKDAETFWTELKDAAASRSSGERPVPPIAAARASREPAPQPPAADPLMQTVVMQDSGRAPPRPAPAQAAPPAGRWASPRGPAVSPQASTQLGAPMPGPHAPFPGPRPSASPPAAPRPMPRWPFVLVALAIVLALLAGGAWAGYRYFWLPRGGLKSMPKG